MNKRTVWLGVIAVVIAAGGISLIALPKSPEWTTDSPEALAEFEHGLAAEMKLYGMDAVRHFDRAVELDPDFAAAKVRLIKYLAYYDKKRAKQLWEDLAETNLDRLRPREQVMIKLALARHEKRFDDAESILDSYVAAHPDDHYMLEAKAIQLFYSGDFEDAELLYRRLLELEPNFVLAYNQLGYITMLQTRFAEAEEYFTSYRFIAPDQANPHDSLGELYVIQGRYEEAKSSFENAIQIKPDFWNSYHGLANVEMLMGDFEGANRTIDVFAALDDAPEWEVQRLRCRLRFSQAEANQDWKAVLAEDAASCIEKGNADEYAIMVRHRAAAQLGDWKRAEAIEAEVRDELESEKDTAPPEMMNDGRALLLHLEGVRLAVQGDYDAAEQRFLEADKKLTFREADSGLFKLHNQTMLVETLLAKGDDASAHQLLAKVRSVNPMVVEEFEEAGLQSLGLERT